MNIEILVNERQGWNLELSLIVFCIEQVIAIRLGKYVSMYALSTIKHTQTGYEGEDMITTTPSLHY